MTATINLAELLTPARQDAIATNMLNRMKPSFRKAFLEGMTPAERRDVEAAIARHSLRKRTDRPWSTEKIRILTAGDTKVTIYPGDHGGWILEAEGMTLTPNGWDNPAEPHYWPTQEAAVEALAATI
ncbi:hypothetical protein [Sphaerimonospora thailandensis]|uniref:Uncharacterized protein n=1 Tax=Sphaerimonospora thailandensis TaxID=795644 RepID=A0A8J3VZZ8_9ACTN|nr:hypothetical protein [Sphaerimonospora thailandensis]GIH70366.1 hypothetical protein Mth01_26190 [Sphaerimonospora thailandensis]